MTQACRLYLLLSGLWKIQRLSRLIMLVTGFTETFNSIRKSHHCRLAIKSDSPGTLTRTLEYLILWLEPSLLHWIKFFVASQSIYMNVVWPFPLQVHGLETVYRHLVLLCSLSRGPKNLLYLLLTLAWDYGWLRWALASCYSLSKLILLRQSHPFPESIPLADCHQGPAITNTKSTEFINSKSSGRVTLEVFPLRKS